MTVTLPLDFTPPPDGYPPPSPFGSRVSLPPIKRRVISEELDAVLRSGSNNTSALPTSLSPERADDTPLSSSPPAANGVDFTSAVSAARAALFPPPSAPTLEPPSLLKRTSSRTSRRVAATPPIPILNSTGGQEDLVVEVAKLSLAVSPAVAAADVGTPSSEAGPSSTTNGASAGPTKRKVKVLCAEDNPIGRNILVKLFTGKGIDFAAAEDGQEAVELYEAAKGEFTICFMDVQVRPFPPSFFPPPSY